MAVTLNDEFVSRTALILASYIGSSPYLNIYKGTMPTSGDYTDWDLYESSRSSDLLVTLPDAVVEGSVPAIYFDQNKPTPTNASATGTATWGAWVGSSSLKHAIVGPVNDVAGGTGLFMLDDVNIVSGNLVTCIGFRLVWS